MRAMKKHLVPSVADSTQVLLAPDNVRRGGRKASRAALAEQLAKAQAAMA